MGGPLAVLRLSGKDLSVFCQKLGIAKNQAREALYKDIFGLDAGLVIFFSNPKSFTGEDVLEFHIHGSDRICESLLEKLEKLGALRALPGEFSFRAFMN